MAEKKLNLKIPGQSIAYIVLCLIGLLILVFGGIVPGYSTLGGINGEISALKSRMEERKIIVPLYESFRKQSEIKAPDVLPLPPEGKLSIALLGTLPGIFRKEAGASGMKLISVVPNLNAMTGNAQSIFVDVILRGNFPDFRKFLLHIGGIPYIRHIEEIEVQVGPDSRDYRLKISIAIG